MLREHRLRKIEDALARQPFLEVKTLAQQLRVSDATVRRDLEALHRDGRLKRTRGGAMPHSVRERRSTVSSLPLSTPTINDSTDPAVPFAQRKTINASAKERIGAAAAKLARDGQSILLAGGTTCLAAARHLRNHHVSVVTNSLPAAVLLGGTLGVDVTVTGGMVYSRRDLLIGPHVAQTLAHIHSADLLFLGCSGANAEGLFDSNHWEVEAQRELMARANKVVLLLDAAKFDRRDMVFVAPWREVDILITDAPPEQSGGDELTAALREAEVEVIVAHKDAKER
jgi:DeoR/GlpR family transcriptional regulator of sugar metabolism